MDRTIKVVHEGQTLSNANIQLLMKKMDIFGAQMVLLKNQCKTPEKNNATPTRLHLIEKNTLHKNEEVNAKLASIGDNIENVVMTPIDTVLGAQGDEDNAWDEDFVASPSDFDAIMVDAETKKRMASNHAKKSDTAKKKKAMTAANIHSWARRTRWGQINGKLHLRRYRGQSHTRNTLYDSKKKSQ